MTEVVLYQGKQVRAMSREELIAALEEMIKSQRSTAKHLLKVHTVARNAIRSNETRRW